MIRLRATFWLLVPLLIAGGWIALAASKPADGTSRYVESPLSVPVIAAPSCSAQACHGGLAPGIGSEYTTWVMHDPHAQAYAVLFDERSRVIEKNLKKLARLDDAHPEKNTECLNCHGRSAARAETKPYERQWLADGFGCESCHGSADKWLGPHTTAGWGKLDDKAKHERFGMKPLMTIQDRAHACAECHVGTANQEVNHDLIAAGHPRLAFEYSSYLANLPRHWRPAKDSHHRNEPEVWLQGQVATAQAAAALLASRASNHKKPWPEFAEHDCRSCHRDLQGAAENPGGSGRFPGSVALSTWYLAMPARFDRETYDAMTNLDKAMAKPLPDRKEAAQLAARCAQALAQSKNWNLDKDPARASSTLLEKVVAIPLAGEKQPPRISNWEEATQVVGGLSACRVPEGNAKLQDELTLLHNMCERKLHFEHKRPRANQVNDGDFLEALSRIKKVLAEK